MENQNQNPKAQLIERLKQANNVLVTVSRNPSVDQLSAAIGLTLMLNQLGKHATAVFSGEIPNTLEFLKPEDTLEKTTDSLRDFIISLDKSKADKLRYKVEDKMVKIFITPYRTSLSEADLIYEQGDFNVDVIVALGVHEKEDLDEAIINHGRILHDATVATVNTTASGQLGSINWIDTQVSSLSEMLVGVCESLKSDGLDGQMATAFLTGIVAETQRFSNEKTSSDTMNVSAKLMAAGANQQLVATQLAQHGTAQQPLAEAQAAEPAQDGQGSDGSLEINHGSEEPANEEVLSDLPEVQPNHSDEQDQESDDTEEADRPSRLVLEPPTLGGKLTANSEPESLDPSTDPLTLPATDAPLLSHEKSDKKDEAEVIPATPSMELEDTPFPDTVKPPEPTPAALEPIELVSTQESVAPSAEPSQPPLEPIKEEPINDTQTLSDLETAVDSPHVAVEAGETPAKPDAEAALAAAHQAFDSVEAETSPKPADFNASSPMEVSHDQDIASNEPTAETAPVHAPTNVIIDPNTGEISYPSNLVPPSTGLPADPTAATVKDPTAPPEVPPPLTIPPLMPPQSSIDPDHLPPVNP